ncbi:MAG: prolipoprotein diacylglyceryl transferase [Planctomycetes bacterium]|nr:prolipoprotein diacylglyceryl transferase [Planctomycetota bacterium]
MHPELFEIPFIHLTVKSYGMMMVVGFLAAVFVMGRIAKQSGCKPEQVTNAALYSLLVGILGARMFYVFHHRRQFIDNFFSVFAVWQGGLEFLGGVVLVIVFLVLYLRHKRQPTWEYMDILAIGLMIGLGFGRIGCLLNGCCHGKVTDSAVGVRFPYDSFAYNSQVRPDLARHRTEPYLKIDDGFFGYLSADGSWIPAAENKYDAALKPFDKLTDTQKQLVTTGPYRCLKVLPTQIISSVSAFLLAVAAYLFWRKYASHRPGLIVATLLWAYGVMRFLIEYLRDDNPFEYAWWAIYRGGTISQNICLYLIILGVLLTIFIFRKPAKRD